MQTFENSACLFVSACVCLCLIVCLPLVGIGAGSTLLWTTHIFEPFPCSDLSRLRQVALGNEYGPSSTYIQKWQRNIAIQVLGQPRPEDWETLRRVVSELNQLQPQVRLTILAKTLEGNVQVKFLPYAAFAREPHYIPHNKGFFSADQDQGALYQARILIAADQITQQERNHLLREELTQILGLFNDTADQPESIFETRWTRTQQYSAQDKRLIRLLYSPELKPGTPAASVESVFCGRYFDLGCLRLSPRPCLRQT